LNVQKDKNDNTSWNHIFIHYNDYINNIVKKYIFEKQYQNDVVQESWIKIIRSIKSYDTNKPFKNWLYTLTKNVCFTWLKTNIQNNVLTNSITSLDFDELDLGFEQNFEKSLITEDALNRALENVKNVDAALAFKLKIINNLSLNEISNILGKPIKTVKNWIYRDVPKQIKPVLEKSF
jgi:RNA polymerase sigma-70 factor (ECF subfamily)